MLIHLGQGEAEADGNNKDILLIVGFSYNICMSSTSLNKLEGQLLVTPDDSSVLKVAKSAAINKVFRCICAIIDM